jgi:hypothetical protein
MSVVVPPFLLCTRIQLCLQANKNQTNYVAWMRERTILTEVPPLVGEVSDNFADRGCHMVSVTDPYGRILVFLHRNRYFFFQVAPQLDLRGWEDSVPDPLLVRKSGSAGNRTRTSESVARYSGHNYTKEKILHAQFELCILPVSARECLPRDQCMYMFNINTLRSEVSLQSS